MADLVVVAGDVVAVSGATSARGTAGATITAGQLVYLNSTSGKYALAQGDDAATDAVVGIAAHGASDGQPLQVLTGGVVDLGVTLTVGEIYVLSAASAGGIAPKGDLSSGEYVSIIGVAQTADNLLLGILNSGVAVPA